MEKETQFFKQVDTFLAEMAAGRKSREVVNIIYLNVELKDARIKLSLTITFLNVARIKYYE